MADEIKQKVAARLKHFRIQKGYSNYEKFANEIGMNRTQYGRYEKGVDLQLSSLVRILQALEVTLEEFFEGFDSW